MGASKPGSWKVNVHPGAIPSPNIWHHTATYELENRAVDPSGRLEAEMRTIADWADRDVLDLGCGTGFHLPRFAATAVELEKQGIKDYQLHYALGTLKRLATAPAASARASR